VLKEHKVAKVLRALKDRKDCLVSKDHKVSKEHKASKASKGLREFKAQQVVKVYRE
jgi:hypothetical protein